MGRNGKVKGSGKVGNVIRGNRNTGVRTRIGSRRIGNIKKRRKDHSHEEKNEEEVREKVKGKKRKLMRTMKK